MGEKMTLDLLKARLRYMARFGGLEGLDVHQMCIECSQIADHLDHLATPAQTVDVEAVRWVIAALKYMAQNGGVELDAHELSIDCSKMADKLTQAIEDKP